jgi:tetratricopeptide (TPR) repeat protein
METELRDDPRYLAQGIVSQARELVRTLDFDAAHSLFAEAHSLYDQEVMLYVGLAELALGKGDLELAEKYVQIALWIPATNNQSKAEAILLGAEISQASDDNEEALRRYEIAYKAIIADTSYGWGSYGWSPYAWFVFQRLAFPEDVLPQLARADISMDVAKRLLPLIDLYEGVGKTQKADEVSETLSQYPP